jgi:hypothetical protein
MPGGPTYTREEMDAILKRALARQQEKSDGIGHDELVAAAAEVGIPREEIEAAAREVHPASKPEDVRFAEAERTRAANRLRASFVTWCVVSAGLFVLCEATGGNWWFWVAIPWGLAVALQWVQVTFPSASPTRMRESRRERRRRRREEKLRHFERTVEVGTTALLRVVAETRRIKGGDVAEPARARVAESTKRVGEQPELDADERVEERDRPRPGRDRR